MIHKLRRMRRIATALFLAMVLSMLGTVVQASLNAVNTDPKPYSKDDMNALLDTQTAHVLLDYNAKRLFLNLHAFVTPEFKELSYCCNYVSGNKGDLIEQTVFLKALAQVTHLTGIFSKSHDPSECDHLLRQAHALVEGLDHIVVDVETLLNVESADPKELLVSSELTKIFTNRIDPIQPDGTPDTTATATVSGFLHCERSVSVAGTASVDRISPFTDGEPVVVCADLCVKETKTLRVDAITAKSVDGTVTFESNVCIEAGNELQVETIVGKDGNPVNIIGLVIEDVDVASDLCISGSVVTDTIEPKTPGGAVLVSSDLCVDGSKILRTNEINTKSGTILTVKGDSGVSVRIGQGQPTALLALGRTATEVTMNIGQFAFGETTLNVGQGASDLIAANFGEGATAQIRVNVGESNTSTKKPRVDVGRDATSVGLISVYDGSDVAVSIDGGIGICVAPTLTVQTDWIKAKTVSGTVSIADHVCIAAGKTLSVDRIRSKSGGNIDVGPLYVDGNLCIDESKVLQTNQIDTKSGDDLFIKADSDTIVTRIGGGHMIGALVVGQSAMSASLQVGTSASTLATVDIGMNASAAAALKVGAFNTSATKPTINVGQFADSTGLVNVFDGATAAIEIDGEAGICVHPTLTVQTDWINAKTPGGTVTISDNVCIAAGKTLTVDSIRSKTGGALDLGPVDVTGDLCLDATNTLRLTYIVPKDGNCGRIFLDGNITVTGSLLELNGCPSDQNLKTNVEKRDSRQSMKAILALQPVAFTYTPEFAKSVGANENEKQIGFIAQEVKKHLPEVVSMTTFKVPGTEQNNFHTVKYDKLVVDLVGALQESHKDVEFLKTELERLDKIVAQFDIS